MLLEKFGLTEPLFYFRWFKSVFHNCRSVLISYRSTEEKCSFA